MIQRSGVLLVERVNWWAEGRSRRGFQPAVPVSQHELLHRYRGIDGRPWPDELCIASAPGGVAPVQEWETLAALVANDTARIYDLLFVAIPPGPISPPIGAAFLGFDVGILDEYNDYSSVFHEVICGSIPELREYATRLNDALLFGERADADAYLRLHGELRTRGADVEDDDCLTIAIYGEARSSSSLQRVERIDRHE